MLKKKPGVFNVFQRKKINNNLKFHYQFICQLQSTHL